MLIMRNLVPLHADMWRLSASRLAAGGISSVMLGIFAAWLPVALYQKPWRRIEPSILLIGFVFGLLSFAVQGRGYPYHRYPSEAFLLLLAAQAFESGLMSSRRPLVLASSLGLAFGSLIVVPKSLAAICRFNGTTDEYGSALMRDLSVLRQGQDLNHQVQCFDQAGGCITQLYKARIVQSTGFLYDCYLFVEPRNAQDARDQEFYRQVFLNSVEAANPKYLVVTSDECGLRADDFSYSKLQAWPTIDNVISRRYDLLQEWMPDQMIDWGGKPRLPYGFRIYERKG